MSSYFKRIETQRKLLDPSRKRKFKDDGCDFEKVLNFSEAQALDWELDLETYINIKKYLEENNIAVPKFLLDRYNWKKDGLIPKAQQPITNYVTKKLTQAEKFYIPDSKKNEEVIIVNTPPSTPAPVVEEEPFCPPIFKGYTKCEECHLICKTQWHKNSDTHRALKLNKMIDFFYPTAKIPCKFCNVKVIAGQFGTHLFGDKDDKKCEAGTCKVYFKAENKHVNWNEREYK